MRKHRSYPVEFKRQVAQEYLRRAAIICEEARGFAKSLSRNPCIQKLSSSRMNYCEFCSEPHRPAVPTADRQFIPAL
jgi:hypothetical protein